MDQHRASRPALVDEREGGLEVGQQVLLLGVVHWQALVDEVLRRGNTMSVIVVEAVVSRRVRTSG